MQLPRIKRLLIVYKNLYVHHITFIAKFAS